MPDGPRLLFLHKIDQLVPSRGLAWLSQMSSSPLARRALAVFTTNWVSNASRFLLGVYIVRQFGPEGKGAYALLLSGASLVALLFSLGISNSLVYHLKKKKITSTRALGMAIATGLLVAACTWMLLQMFGTQIWGLLFQELPYSSTWMAVIIAYVPASFLMLFFRSCFLVHQDTGKHRILTAVTPLCVLAITVGLTLWVSQTLQMALIALLLTEYTAIIWAGVCVYRKTSITEGTNREASKEKARDGEPDASIAEILSYGLRGHIGTVGTSFSTRADIFVLAAYTSPILVGYYSVAKFLYQTLMSIPQAVNGLLLGAYCDRDFPSVCKLNSRVIKSMGILMLLLAVPALILGGPFITWVYGDDFVAAVLPLQILLASAVFMGISSPFTPLFLSQDRPGIVSKIGILAGTAKLALAFLLISQFSIVGAAVSSLLSSLLILLLRFRYSTQLANSLRQES